MQTRILPEAEWPRLTETGCLVQQAYRDAASGGCVLVTENDNGDIVGTLFLTLSARLDGAWVREDYRDGSTLRQLGRAGMRWATDVGVRQVFAPVTNSTLAAWLQKRFKAQRHEELLIPVVTHG